MNPAEPYPTAPTPPVTNPLTVMQPGETVICEIKRHPIGILGVYGMVGTLLVVLAVIIFGIAPNVITTVSQSQVYTVGGAGFALFLLIGLGFVAVANKIYWGNRWVVTSDSITQISQSGLFDKQSSQLSLGNLEDVTAEQDGILAHMFHYGLVRVETAGERSKFVFLFCPNPNYYAQQILGARERFEQSRRGDDLQRPYRANGAYQQPAASAAAATSYSGQPPVPPAGGGPGQPA